MEEWLIDFLNDNEELVNNSRWEEVYDKCRPKLRGQLTDCLLAADLQIFQDIDKIPDMAFYESKIIEFIIPNNIISISEGAFSSCYSLTSITIPDSVTSIGEYAFSGCKNLEIKYNGTKSQWKELAKGKFSKVTYTCTCKDGVLKKSR